MANSSLLRLDSVKIPSHVCILGGCGAMGRVIVTCLLRLDPTIRITVADLQPPPFPLPSHVQFQRVDLRRHMALVRILRSHTLVINSTSHHFNLLVMQAALQAHTHYLDLGGLFHFTRRQLKMHAAFREKGLLAILGMGCAPGISNLLGRWAAEGMDRVEEIHIKVGDRSWGELSHTIPYAIRTIREELTLKPAVYHDGRWCFKKPCSGVGWFKFPFPVGRQKIFYTLHSEIATFPTSFPGLHDASFKIGFSDEIIRAALAPKTFEPQTPTIEHLAEIPPRDCEITVALVRGRICGKRITRTASCAAFSSANHSAGDWDTAWPPAIATQMVVRGEIQASGVFPPEVIVPIHPFLQRLKQRGFKLRKDHFKIS